MPIWGHNSEILPGSVLSLALVVSKDFIGISQAAHVTTCTCFLCSPAFSTGHSPGPLGLQFMEPKYSAEDGLGCPHL